MARISEAGEAVDVRDHVVAGKVTVFDFYAVWCKPCREVDEHMQQVRQLELDIAAAESQSELTHPEPEIDPEIELVNDNTPAISRMQIELLVNALANNMTRVASLQFMRSVGQARMRWLDINEGHHSLSHEPDDNAEAYDKLKRINAWFAGELAYLCQRLAETPEPGGVGGSRSRLTAEVRGLSLSYGRRPVTIS